MRHNGMFFVLWAAGLDELAATIFVTELRRVGLPVKMVGLRRRVERGAFGLGLLPDLTLEQATVYFPQVRCLILPGPAERLTTLLQHPRLDDLLSSVATGGIIVSRFELRHKEPVLMAGKSHLSFPGSEELVAFAKQLAERLEAG